MDPLPKTLAVAGRTWHNYADPRESYFDHIEGLAGHEWNVPANQFDEDVKKESLPDVAWFYAPAGLSEHPGDALSGPARLSSSPGTIRAAGTIMSSRPSPLHGSETGIKVTGAPNSATVRACPASC
jgi:hypothetical protein